jgi:glutamate synthase domain-containing protein 3
VANLLRIIAEDARRTLSELGVSSLGELRGRTSLLQTDSCQESFLKERGVDLSFFTQPEPEAWHVKKRGKGEIISDLNQRIAQDLADLVPQVMREEVTLSGQYSVRSIDRAVGAHLAGLLAREVHADHTERLKAGETVEALASVLGKFVLRFEGSAGQGFGIFCRPGLELILEGEANDSVGKSMSGGRIIINPPRQASYAAGENSIVGNVAFYGATGGTAFVHGLAGDRFAVRNSGALVVVEGVAMHACEYMTNGTVVILGPAGQNIAAGMTGGTLYLHRANASRVNTNLVCLAELEDVDRGLLSKILAEYHEASGSARAAAELLRVRSREEELIKCVPK